MLTIYGFTNSLGVGSVVPVINSEIPSLRLRSKSAGIGFGAQSLFSWVVSFFVPYLFSSDAANWGGKIGFFFAGLCTLGFAMVWLEVPETKGRTDQDLDYLFEMKTKTRAFRSAAVPVRMDDYELQKPAAQME
jgi:SP family general alpha glucoside:H+ symporter-like MFS transporter